MGNKSLLSHPKGLYVLFFTELWERFSFYGMKAILVLFLMASVSGENPGFGWTKDEALLLFSFYTGLVYVLGIPGGLLADLVLGQRKTVMIGGGLLCAGHLLLAYTQPWAFFTALVLIVLGVGALKPNISTMVGGLYKHGDARRESAFTIFYMGINLGSLLATILVATIGEVYGWHYGFTLAGIGMLLGQIVYIWGQPHLRHVGNLHKKSDDMYDAGSVDEQRVQTSDTEYKTTIKKDSRTLFTKKEWDRVIVILLSFLIIIVFWMSFEQAGGLLTIFAKEKVDRNLLGITIPASAIQSLNPFFIILLSLPIGWFWSNLSNTGRNPGAPFKMGLGTAIMGVGFVFMAFAALEFQRNATASLVWFVLAYFFHTVGELCLSPVALSFITKVAPKKITSLMMGAFFAMSGVANFLAGMIGRTADDFGEYEVFMALTIIPITLGLIMMVFSKMLKKLTHGTDT